MMMDQSNAPPGGGGGGGKAPNGNGGPPPGPEAAAAAAASDGQKPHELPTDPPNDHTRTDRDPAPPATIGPSGRIALGPGAYRVMGPGGPNRTSSAGVTSSEGATSDAVATALTPEDLDDQLDRLGIHRADAEAVPVEDAEAVPVAVEGEIRNIRLSFTLPLAFFFAICGCKLAAIARRPSGRVRGRLVKDLQAYAFLPGQREPQFLEEVDPSTVFKNEIVSIDFAHKHGLLHSGALILVADANGEILLLKRGPKLATCPNAWGGVGEHAIRDEAPLATARRGILEELGQSVLDDVVSMNSTARQKAKDNTRLDLDEEVADHRWIGLEKYLDWINRDLQQGDDGPREFCCDTVAKIRRFSAERLKEFRSKNL